MTREVIEQLASRMQTRVERSWSAALTAAVKERLVDPVELQQARSRFGEAGAKWLYDSCFDDVVSEEVTVDDANTVETRDPSPFDDVGTEPGVLSLDELIERLIQIRRADPLRGASAPMACLPGILRGFTDVQFRATRENPVSEADYAVVLVLQ